MTEAVSYECFCDDDCPAVREGASGDQSAAMVLEDRRGKCFPLVYAFIKSVDLDAGYEFISGTVHDDGEDPPVRNHVWVVDRDGWVWEPTNNVWLHSEEALAGLWDAVAVERFTAATVLELGEAGEPIGLVGWQILH